MKQSNKKLVNWRNWLALASCTVGFYTPVHGSEAQTFPISWVEMGPSGLVTVRAVTTQPDCPSVTLDGQSKLMQVRALPQPDFPIRICETTIPSRIKDAKVEGQPLPLPKADPQRVVVIGDTGCRIKAPGSFQACNDPNAWPFATIAASAAAWQPDLVIHIGDYLYRETPCPDGNAGCAGSPWGDTWATWKDDFFTPALPLLKTSPWVMVRGNHEHCARAGRGWFLLLDPRPAPEPCPDITEPYSVEAGSQQLLVLDSAAAEEAAPTAELVAAYEKQFAVLKTLASSRAWLLTHRPPGSGGDGNKTLQAALRNGLPVGIQVVLSGHAHLFGLVSNLNTGLTQVIVGNSGAALHRELVRELTRASKDNASRGITGANAKAIASFGFVTIERAADSWTWTARDVNGAPLITCRLDRTAGCSP